MNAKEVPPKGEWFARVYALGEEPSHGLLPGTTAEQRFALVGELTRRMWSLTGRPLPAYGRASMPCRVFRR